MNLLRTSFKPALLTSSKMTNSALFHTSNGIEKPDLDDREYKIIQLENKLTALLIQDPKTDKSAASIDVNIGSFSDFSHLPGLAHFCEHLLFMGTKKYPSENEYSSYLSNHGGHSNAYTASENTNYYFEINHQYLEGALDRFSQFFISPLFDPNCKDREILAVDSENKKNLQNDTWRLYQLDKSLSNPKHPYNKFSTGNFQTLNKPNVRDELLKFYKENYSSNLMKLVIIGREDLNMLEKWTVEKFSEIPNFNTHKPEFSEPVFTKNELKKLIRAKPVMNKNKLSLQFVVPDFENDLDSYYCHVPSYFSHLIGHECNGSILHYLKSKDLANELSAGGYTISENNAIFNINIDLTEFGLENYEQVLEIIFQYLKMLKYEGPKEYIFHELRDISEMNFKFKQKVSPSSTVSKLSKDLQKSIIPNENLLSKDIFKNFNPKLINEYCESLNNLDNLRITLISQSLDTDKKETWYSTDYSVEDIPTQLIEKLSKVEVNNEKLYLPTPNEFIPTNFEVDKIPTNESSIAPTLIENSTGFKSWFKKDDKFYVPKSFIQILLTVPKTNISVDNCIMTSLFVELLDDELNDLSYQASMAGLHLSINQTKNGLYLNINGYNEKSMVLLGDVLETLKTFEVNENRFNTLKEKLIKNLENFNYKVPYLQVTNYFNVLLNEKSYGTDLKLESIKRVQFEQFKQYKEEFFKDEIFVESLIHGNFNKDEAQEINELIKKSFQELSKLSSNIKPSSYILPAGSKYIYHKKLVDEKNLNSCIQYYIQIGDLSDIKMLSLTELFLQLIKEPVFNVLRTKEQLGYIVFSGLVETRTQFGLRVIVQSEKSCGFLETRIDEFFKNYLDVLDEMTEEEFNKNVDALVNKKLENLKNLHQENSRIFYSINNGLYDFDHHKHEAEEIKLIKKAQVVDFFKKYVLNGDLSAKLIVGLVAHDAKQEDETTGANGTEITDVAQFKQGLQLSSLPAQ